MNPVSNSESNPFSLVGHQVLITGASRGIGRAIALAMATAGADVGLLARNKNQLDVLADEISSLGKTAFAISADVTNQAALSEAVNRCAERLGGLTCIVTNAGGNTFSAPFVATRPEGFSKAMHLNFESVITTLQAGAPHIAKHPGIASVINVASVAGIRGAPMMSHYGAAKAAIVSLTKSLAIEWATAGVRVNALLPGWVATDLTEFLREDSTTEKGILKQIPMSRWGQPPDIAAPAVFLASSAASYLTGQVLIVDGGLTV